MYKRNHDLFFIRYDLPATNSTPFSILQYQKGQLIYSVRRSRFCRVSRSVAWLDKKLTDLQSKTKSYGLSWHFLSLLFSKREAVILTF